jgi:hypothetical protein
MSTSAFVPEGTIRVRIVVRQLEARAPLVFGTEIRTFDRISLIINLFPLDLFVIIVPIARVTIETLEKSNAI